MKLSKTLRIFSGIAFVLLISYLSWVSGGTSQAQESNKGSIYKDEQVIDVKQIEKLDEELLDLKQQITEIKRKQQNDKDYNQGKRR